MLRKEKKYEAGRNSNTRVLNARACRDFAAEAAVKMERNGTASKRSRNGSFFFSFFFALFCPFARTIDNLLSSEKDFLLAALSGSLYSRSKKKKKTAITFLFDESAHGFTRSPRVLFYDLFSFHRYAVALRRC